MIMGVRDARGPKDHENDQRQIFFPLLGNPSPLHIDASRCWKEFRNLTTILGCRVSIHPRM